MNMKFEIEVSYSAACKHCDYEARAGAWKWVYMKLLWHLKFKCPNKTAASRDLPFFKSMWDLWRLPS